MLLDALESQWAELRNESVAHRVQVAALTAQVGDMTGLLEAALAATHGSCGDGV